MKINEIENNIAHIASDVFSKIKNTLELRFESGAATCTVAALELGRAFNKHNIPFNVISGDYANGGHYWIESNNAIYDLGNNLTHHALDTGRISPIITNVSDTKYKREDVMSFDEYEHLFNTELKKY